MRIGGVRRICDETSPEKGSIKGLYVESGDDTEVTRATLESLPEVRVFALIRIDNTTVLRLIVNGICQCTLYLPVGENNLKIDDLVTAKSATCSIESVTAPSQEASNTNSRGATASGSDAIRLQGLVDISPNGPCLDLSDLCFLDIRGLVHQT
jgi:hypothetical protein